MVIQSGNDASVALAEAAAGSEEAFAERMNSEAKRLGLNDTHFLNSSGFFDNAEPRHYSTARDLASLRLRWCATIRKPMRSMRSRNIARKASCNTTGIDCCGWTRLSTD